MESKKPWGVIALHKIEQAVVRRIESGEDLKEKYS